jgi:hypothetical protein
MHATHQRKAEGGRVEQVGLVEIDHVHEVGEVAIAHVVLLGSLAADDVVAHTRRLAVPVASAKSEEESKDVGEKKAFLL